MSTSNSYNYAATASDAVTEALELVGAIPEGGTPNSAQLTSALRSLNMMIKAWSADDLQLWVAQRATLFPLADTVTYAIGPTGDKVASTYVKTALSADAAASATTITVDSVTGIANGYNIGIILSDGTSHWTTVNGAPSGLTVTLTAGLASAALDGAQVYCYPTTAVIQRPLKMLEMWRHSDSGTDIPIRIVSRLEYDELPNKTAESLAVQAFYNPLINSGPINSNGELQIWPGHSDLTTLIQFRYTRPIQDIDASTDDFDFPQEWYEALTRGLAYRLSSKYGVPLQERYLMRKDAEDSYKKALDWSIENASVLFQPDYYGHEGF